MNSWNQNQNNLVVGQAQFNPYQNPMWTSYNTQRLPVYRADPIHGENAAWQFPMGPNSEIYLPDENNDIIWWIRTDATGNRTIKPLDVKPHEESESVDINSILERLTLLEEKVNAKQTKPNAKRNATTVATESIVSD